MAAYPALALQPSTFDPVGVLQASQGIQNAQIRNRLAEMELALAPERNRIDLENARTRSSLAQMELQHAPERNRLALEGMQAQTEGARLNLTNARDRQTALSRFGQQGGIGNAQALDALSAHPELYTSALGAYTTRQQASTMEAARAAQRVASYPEGSEERQNAYLMELDRARQTGLLDENRHRQLSTQPPTDLFLQGIISQATPISNEPSFRDIMSMPLGGRQAAPPAAVQAPAPAAPVSPEFGDWSGFLSPPSAAAPSGVPAVPPAVSPPQAPPAAAPPGTRAAAPGNVGESIQRILPQGTPGQQARFWTLFAGKSTRDDAMKLLQEIESGGTPLTARQRAESEEGLRREFAGLAKPYFDVRDAYTRIEQVAQNPSAAGDLALIFNFMKMLDPGSTVREGEFATAASAAGVPERIVGLYNRIWAGERLTPDQRSDFVGQSGRLFTTQERQYQAIQGRYLDIAQRGGLDPRNVFVDYSRPQAPQPETSAGAASPGATGRPQGPARIANDADYNALAPGTEFVGPDGIRRRKPDAPTMPAGAP